MKNSIPILIALALLAASCGGGSTTHNQSGDAATKPAYQYVEPTEDIAHIIWDYLTKNDHDIWDAALEADDNDQLEDCLTFESKSAMKFGFSYHTGPADGNSYYAAQLQMKCYQMPDSSWLAVIAQQVQFSTQLEEYEEYYRPKIYALNYKNGKITRTDSTKIFPKEFFVLNRDGKNIEWRIHWTLGNTYIVGHTHQYWPVKFNYDGEKFVTDPETAIVANAISSSNGEFRLLLDTTFYYIDWDREPEKWLGVKSDGIMKDLDGNPIARLTLTDGKITAYTIIGKGYGIAQDYKSYDSISCKPVALGYPIKNVLDYDKSNQDTTIKQGTKDGKYVITQQLEHSDTFHRDVFIEYVAKDENSPIESIHVYRQLFTVTLADQVNSKPYIHDQTKQIFSEFKFTDRISGCGEFQYLMDTDGNGFSIKFDNTAYRFQIYPKDGVNNLCLVIVAHATYNGIEPDGIEYWVYNNGTFTKTPSLTLPRDECIDDHYTLDMDDNGIEWSCREYASFISYIWNGKQFVSPYDDQEPSADQAPAPTGEKGIALEAWLCIYGNDRSDEEIEENKARWANTTTQVIECFQGDEYSTACFTTTCYKMTYSTYLVLCYQEQTDNSGIDIYRMTTEALLDYDKNPFDTDLIKKNTSEHAHHQYEFCGYLSNIDDKGFVLNTDNGKTRFNWDGEKFVKQ